VKDGRAEFARYALAVLGFIGIGMLTKYFLTWTWGPIYFVTVLDLLPRAWRAARARGRRAAAPAAGAAR
jgi:hypothetical protein